MEIMPGFTLTEIETSGAQIRLRHGGSGPPLFLVAGLGGDGRFWGANVEALARHFTVIVHDHRGTGRSTLSRITYSVAQMADDALQLIDALGYAKVHWCGHSTGGAIELISSAQTSTPIRLGERSSAPRGPHSNIARPRRTRS